jgi:hypothetical protein
MTDKNQEKSFNDALGKERKHNSVENAQSNPPAVPIEEPAVTEVKNAHAAGDGAYGRDNDTLYDEPQEKSGEVGDETSY